MDINNKILDAYDHARKAVTKDMKDYISAKADEIMAVAEGNVTIAYELPAECGSYSDEIVFRIDEAREGIIHALTVLCCVDGTAVVIISDGEKLRDYSYDFEDGVLEKRSPRKAAVQEKCLQVLVPAV